MAGTPKPETIPDVRGASILIVEARYHAHVNDMLLEGARALLEHAGCDHRTLTLPGALEIPPAIAMVEDGGLYEGFVALGCVIRGETTHYELVANESCRGLMNLGLVGRAIGNGILTVENEAQAVARADPGGEDKGGHAALAAVALVRWRRELRGST